MNDLPYRDETRGCDANLWDGDGDPTDESDPQCQHRCDNFARCHGYYLCHERYYPADEDGPAQVVNCESADRQFYREHPGNIALCEECASSANAMDMFKRELNNPTLHPNAQAAEYHAALGFLGRSFKGATK